MAELFGVNADIIGLHLRNIYREEELETPTYEESSVVRFESNVRKTHFANADRPTALYGLDMILAVGYRINSKRGIAFHRWANTVLKQYLVEGYALNEKRLSALNRTADVQCALLCLAFLHKNGMLVKSDGPMAIANDGLAALTILIAESKPEEKGIMVAVTMNMTGK